MQLKLKPTKNVEKSVHFCKPIERSTVNCSKQFLNKIIKVRFDYLIA